MKKLRRQDLATDHVTVFHHTPEHDRVKPQRVGSKFVTLPEAANDTRIPLKAVIHGVGRAWLNGFHFSKAAIVSTDLVPFPATQRAIPGLGQLDREMGAALMVARDACIRRFGRGAVVLAADVLATKQGWSTMLGMRSPRYSILSVAGESS